MHDKIKSEFDKKFYAEKEALCDRTSFKIPSSTDGYEITVYVYTPKSLKDKMNPAYVYARGGGGVLTVPEMFHGLCCVQAVNQNCVVFNVGYRLGPEAKCP